MKKEINLSKLGIRVGQINKETFKELLNRLDLTINRRILAIIIFFAFMYSGIIFKLVNISLNGEPANLKKPRILATDTLNERASIVDRNGALLATNLKTVSLYAKPHLIKDTAIVAEQLKKIFPKLDREQLIKDFKSEKKFVWIKRNLTPKEQYAVNNLGIPALEFQEGSKRVYPNGNLLSHLVGYVGIDNEGLAGVERFFNQKLSETGQTKNHLELSVDLTIQTIVGKELAKGIGAVGGESGAAIVMDINNGEILSLVSLPDFNPHSPGKSKPETLFNRVTLGLYEMGSVSKPFTFAMALEEKVTDVNYIYEVDNPIKTAGFQIHDYKGGKGGWLSFPEIFMYSSNIGTSKIIKEVGKNNQIKWLKKLGILDPLKIELLERSSPMYPSFDKWGETSMYTISFGHGIAVTPLHIVKATAPLINGGYIVEPTLLKNLSSTLGEKAISNETNAKLRKLYRLNVEHGTGGKADVAGYFVGGKTGSTNKAYKGGYSVKGGTLSVCITIFPMYDPKYIVLAMVEDAKTATATGGQVAAPIAGAIISQIAPILNIKPVPEDDPEIKEKLHLQYYYHIDQLDYL